jgi:hypothetical protein
VPGGGGIDVELTPGPARGRGGFAVRGGGGRGGRRVGAVRVA